VNPPGTTVTEDEPVLRYEQMRQYALDGDVVSGIRQWGTALLIRQGMAAWLLAAATPHDGPGSPSADRPSPRPDESTLVGVLATVVLNTYWEQCHAS